MNHLGLFAKFWQPGTVKTRLAKSIGDQAACKVYRCFVNHLLERHQATGDTRCVVFSPPEKQSDFRSAIDEAWDISPQSSGDLGVRMGTYFESQFKQMADSNSGEAGATTKVVIIGADCPLLDSAIISAAFELLDQAPVVIAPSRDGGYCLIAMNNQLGKVPDLFSGVDWGTSTVLNQTLEHLKRQKVDYRLMEPLNDVDEIEDLLELKSDLESQTRDDLNEQLFKQVEIAANSVDPSGNSSGTKPDSPSQDQTDA